jgi:hypothetical protein
LIRSAHVLKNQQPDIALDAYRYFFDPPPREEFPWLRQLLEMSAGDDFKVRVAGLHRLDDFRAAITETLERPERGKHFFLMSEDHASSGHEQKT